MGILAFLLLGLIVGAIALALVPGEQGGGIIVTMLLGVMGAFLGGFVGALLFDIDPIDEFFDVSTWLASIAGAVVVVLAYRAITARSGTRGHDMM